jgi:CHAD domain-containing protein
MDIPMERAAGSGATAALVLTPVLRQGVADLRATESDIRLDRAPAVHAFRVAGRRLRSVLTSAATLLDSTDGLVAQLREAGRAASATRDSDVQRQLLLRLLVDEPTGTALLLLRERLDREFEGARRRHWLELVDYLNSPSFDALARKLDRFSDLTPWYPAAKEPAGDVLAPLLDGQRRRFEVLAQRLAAQSSERPGQELDEDLHELRKRAKTVRYFSDALRPCLGGSAKKVRKSMRRAQTVLGDFNDALMLEAFLERRIAYGDLSRDDRRILQRIHAREISRIVYLRTEFLDLYRAPLRRSTVS